MGKNMSEADTPFFETTDRIICGFEERCSFFIVLADWVVVPKRKLSKITLFSSVLTHALYLKVYP